MNATTPPFHETVLARVLLGVIVVGGILVAGSFLSPPPEPEEQSLLPESVGKTVERVQPMVEDGVEKAAKTGAVLWDKASDALDKTIDELNTQPDGK